MDTLAVLYRKVVLFWSKFCIEFRFVEVCPLLEAILNRVYNINTRPVLFSECPLSVVSLWYEH